ncbi:hypothetical protein [Bacillus sp. 1006-3]|uniref:hypothetical protein n=1 Tax=Bacillus sp. 1006-3 TaxID=2922309 RepID=UPI001F0DCE5D|nr:hypothetical protein [Bacillus sp. 1006-3]MCH4866834.1 hypothetical protein [Bacillus sp. 1006-3]
MKELNLNQYVYAKLNEKGKQIIENKHNLDRFIGDDEGVYKFQMWEFMKIFGVHLKMGGSVTEDNCIYFSEDGLK